MHIHAHTCNICKYLHVCACMSMYVQVCVGIWFVFSAVHKKWWTCCACSQSGEINSAKDMQITAKRLWLFWSSNTRRQVHYQHYVPLSQQGWPEKGNDAIYSTCRQLHTYWYLHIPIYTCTYLLIQTHTCTYIHIPGTPNLKRPYLGNQWAVRPEPKNRFNNRPFPTNCAGSWHMERIRHNMAALQKLVKGVNLGAPEHLK